MSPEEFEEFVASVPAREGPFEPFVYHNRQGDMIEVHLSNEMSCGKYINPRLTLLIGRETREIVGVLIEGVSTL